jgi:hypothetical protein
MFHYRGNGLCNTNTNILMPPEEPNLHGIGGGRFVRKGLLR